MLYLDYVLLCLTLVDLVTCGNNSKSKRTLTGPLCPQGCTACSPINGCITCRKDLFLLLHRDGMRQTGMCTHACPVGYYGIRREGFSKCYRCRIENCEACFHKNYCTHCLPPYLAYSGRCIDKCPEGFIYANYSRECVENVDCLVSSWSQWSYCARNGKTCGYKYGQTSRTRAVVQLPSPNGKRCPVTSEKKCCEMAMQSCVDLSGHGGKAKRKKPNRDKEGKASKRRRQRNRHRKRRRRRKTCKHIKPRRQRLKCKKRRERDRQRLQSRRTFMKCGLSVKPTYRSVISGERT